MCIRYIKNKPIAYRERQYLFLNRIIKIIWDHSIRVRDLLMGTDFVCKIENVMQEENQIKKAANQLMDWVDTMKKWGGVEEYDVQPWKPLIPTKPTKTEILMQQIADGLRKDNPPHIPIETME